MKRHLDDEDTERARTTPQWWLILLHCPVKVRVGGRGPVVETLSTVHLLYTPSETEDAKRLVALLERCTPLSQPYLPDMEDDEEEESSGSSVGFDAESSASQDIEPQPTRRPRLRRRAPQPNVEEEEEEEEDVVVLHDEEEKEASSEVENLLQALETAQRSGDEAGTFEREEAVASPRWANNGITHVRLVDSNMF